jgi:hypothetical protein
LLSWMEPNAPDTYQAILDADKISQEKFSRHGSAMAQCYSHLIMPLANSRDKYTQVYWGIRDFEFRFKRLPEGMWLPETAVDLETLDIMADLGIKFTVLAPHQAGRLLPHIENLEHVGEFDIYRPYRINLGTGRSINVFFYNGPLSQSLAFENLLQDGKHYAEKLIQSFPDNHAGLLSVATDGETYGHHHKFGDMALAYTLQYIDQYPDARLTNFAEYLEISPPEHEIQIVEKTSWSCAHGIARWNDDCGCETGGHPEWNQKWREPLRQALDWLKCQADSIFEEVSKGLLNDPWESRNRYIAICNKQLDTRAFLMAESRSDLQESEKIIVLKLLEMQRHTMLMFTSCGWFFNDISGIETEQILSYAGKAIQLAEDISGDILEPQFLVLLEMAESNVREKGNGALIYKDVIIKSRMNFSTICAHYALDLLFDVFEGEAKLYSHSIDLINLQDLKNDRARLVYGSAKVTSNVTLESSRQDFCALHSADYKIKTFVKCSEGAFENIMEPIRDPFIAGDCDEVLVGLEEIFDRNSYPLNAMSKNEQKTIYDVILYSAMSENDESYSRLYDSFEPLNGFLKEQGLPPPKLFLTIIETVLNARLLKEVKKTRPEFHLIEKLLSEVGLHGVSLEVETLGKFFAKGIEKLAQRIAKNPKDLSLLESFETIVRLLVAMPLQVNLWKVQNLCYQMMNSDYEANYANSMLGDGFSRQWISRFNALAESLKIRVPQPNNS